MAFHPALLPFPLLHVDTTWKFREMPAFHDRRAQELGCDLIVHINDDGIREGIDTFVSRSRVHIDVMKTQAPNRYGFDAAFGGTRWDKKKPHTKDGILSLRSSEHRCDPKNQRQAPWTPFDAPKQKKDLRAFPLSDWTEWDVWHYIRQNDIRVVLLNLAALQHDV